jgi:hypothetical protein
MKDGKCDKCGDGCQCPACAATASTEKAACGCCGGHK